MENQEYIIISKTDIQQRQRILESFCVTAKKVGMVTDAIDREIEILKQILSQSTPLIPEIEKAWVDGFSRPDQDYEEQKQDYISNLKLDI